MTSRAAMLSESSLQVKPGMLTAKNRIQFLKRGLLQPGPLRGRGVPAEGPPSTSNSQIANRQGWFLRSNQVWIPASGEPSRFQQRLPGSRSPTKRVDTSRAVRSGQCSRETTNRASQNEQEQQWKEQDHRISNPMVGVRKSVSKSSPK